MINTDMDSYRRSRPRARDESAFAFWLAEGFAFVTPAPTDDTYDKALAELLVGDIVFAYEDSVGIVAMGTVLERADLECYFGTTNLYPNPTEAVKRVKMSWDASINCPIRDITNAGTTPRGGRIPLWSVKSSKMREVLGALVAKRST